MGTRMKTVLSSAMVLSLSFLAGAAELNEYVQTDLVAMWDGYRNMGADKPHDMLSRTWYDTTGQYGFQLNDAAQMGDICCKFSFRGDYKGYGTLSADDTAATFELAKNGTMEIVFLSIYDANAVLLQSSTASGIAFGRVSATSLVTSNASGSPKPVYSILNKYSTVAVNYENGKSVAAYANGTALETSGADYYGTPTTETFIGNRANKGSPFIGYIFAIRLYSRQLTPAEIAQNAAVDHERYFNRKLEASSSYPAVDYMEGVTATRVFEVGNELTVNAAHTAATEYLTANPGETAAVKIPAGTYFLTEPITLAAGEKLVGAGRDKTFLDASDDAVDDGTHVIRLNADDNLVRGVTVMNMDEPTKAGPNYPHAFYVTKGTVDGCRATLLRGQYSLSGVGFYVTGGLVTNSLADAISISDMNSNGLGFYVTGGRVAGCETCYTDTGIGRGAQGGGMKINGTSAVVSGCRIHDCGKAANYGAEEGAGVYLNNGTLENSLVYGNSVNNEARNPTTTAGVHVQNGTMRYCTIVNNQTGSDSSGYSGLKLVNGTVRNCIIVDNYDSTLAPTVTGGTFEKNLVNKAVTGKDDNFVTSDARFADEGAADFHIAVKASAAVGKAVPVAGVETDFDGTARDAEAPTIGAFEFVAQAAEFTAEVLVTQKDWREGSSPTAELVYDGVTDLSKLSVTWYLNGEEVVAARDAVKPAFEGLALGRYDLKAIATYDGQTKEPDEIKEAYRVVPPTVYVNGTGTGTFPYATPETATNVLSVALDAVWKNVAETTRVEIAAGTYPLGSVLNVDSPVVIAGAGRDAVKIVGVDSPSRLIKLNNDGARLVGVTLADSVNGGGLDVAAGVADDCCITNCRASGSPEGVGVRLSGGSLLNSVIVDCHSESTYCYGGGLAVMGKSSVASNCLIRANYMNASHPRYGAGVYIRHGLVTHCRIVDNTERRSISVGNASGGAVCFGSAPTESAPWGTIRNCLLTGNYSRGTAALDVGVGTVENCTVTGNETDEGVAALQLKRNNLNGIFFAVTATNCVAWGNSSLDFAALESSYSNTTSHVVTYAMPVFGYCCYPTAEEGVDGNTAVDPRFKAGRLAGMGVVSSHSTCFRSGAVLDWMAGAVDLNGCPRLTDGKVDIGCYQVGNDPTLILSIR